MRTTEEFNCARRRGYAELVDGGLTLAYRVEDQAGNVLADYRLAGSDCTNAE